MRKKLILLGSTGSIGRQTLAVVRQFPREFEIVGLAGGQNWRLLEAQIREFRPKFVATSLPQKLLDSKILPLEKLAAQKCDLVVSAIAGVAGLSPTLAALRAKNSVALANKESLVLAGGLVMREARKSGVRIFPIDSEHSAVWQLLAKIPREEVRRVILTASGGALRDTPLSEFSKVSPRKVLAHPTWRMGAKITLDCATLANKAFEIIEAAHLFGLPLTKIEAVIHPQSLIHALVETVDGSLLAQISSPDMRLPIQLALFGGVRRESLIKNLSLTEQNLEFRKIERARYPLFFTILDAAQNGGIFPVVAAAASEFFGKRFLAGEIRFPEIAELTKKSLAKVQQKPASLKNILATVKDFV